MHYQLVQRTANAKVGSGVPVTNSHKDTCPPSCPLKDNGCYASSGFHTNLNWKAVTEGKRGSDWATFVDGVAKLKPDTFWRHNVSGDLVGQDDVIDAEALRQLVVANSGKQGFTYTHYPDSKHNIQCVTAANLLGFTVNLSANNIKHAVSLKDKHPRLPVVTVVPSNHGTETTRVGGHNIVVCPATYKEDVTCKTCKLCARSGRESIVAFPSHGSQTKKADIIASDS